VAVGSPRLSKPAAVRNPARRAASRERGTRTGPAGAAMALVRAAFTETKAEAVKAGGARYRRWTSATAAFAWRSKSSRSSVRSRASEIKSAIGRLSIRGSRKLLMELIS
jgi:hypothetical protein